MTNAIHGQIKSDQIDQIIKYSARQGADAIVVQHQDTQILQSLEEILLYFG